MTTKGVVGVIDKLKSRAMTTQGQGFGGNATVSGIWNSPFGVVDTSWESDRSQSGDPSRA